MGVTSFICGFVQNFAFEYWTTNSNNKQNRVTSAAFSYIHAEQFYSMNRQFECVFTDQLITLLATGLPMH